jgi:hypothetical protein
LEHKNIYIKLGVVMKIKNIYIAFSILIYMILFFGCATIKMRENYPPDNNYDKKIAILYHNTKFRTDIVDQLIEKLEAKNILVVVDDAFNTKKYDPKLFDLVVVFSGIHAFIPDAYPNAYIQKYKNEKNIIKVFYTYFSKKGITERTGVKDKIDTITAASMAVNKSGLIDSIYELILNKLEMQ